MEPVKNPAISTFFTAYRKKKKKKGEFVMSTTQPIKNLDDLENLKNYYLNTQPNLRNYAMISTGVNTALRIGDILSLQWKEVYDFQKQSFQTHLIHIEAKTRKQTCIAINQSLCSALNLYLQSLPLPLPEHYIFQGKTPKHPLSRSQAFRIIKQACSDLHLSEHISCHSLRKTFGYHAWIAGVNPAILMVIYNHTSFANTKRYLGIEQDDKDQIFLNLNL